MKESQVWANVPIWVDIPGWPTYQITQFGKARRVIVRGFGTEPSPIELKPTKHWETDCYRMEKDGKRHFIPITNLMIDTFLGGRPDGAVVYFKNGNVHDYEWKNIGFKTREQMGKETCLMAGKRKPVVKVSEYGEELEFYRSARDAAKKNYCSLHYVTNRCKGDVKDEFRDGYSFRWDR